MRRGWLIVLAVFFLILPVSAQADGTETQLGALVLEEGAESAQTTIRNDTAYPVYVLARAKPNAAGSVRLTVRQSGHSAPAFAGDAAALAMAEIRLCTLDSRQSAVMEAASDGGASLSLQLTGRQVEDAVLPDYGRLLLWLGAWLLLVILCSYLAVVLPNKLGRKRRRE